jgi:hypothetical protein
MRPEAEEVVQETCLRLLRRFTAAAEAQDGIVNPQRLAWSRTGGRLEESAQSSGREP